MHSSQDLSPLCVWGYALPSFLRLEIHDKVAHHNSVYYQARVRELVHQHLWLNRFHPRTFYPASLSTFQVFFIFLNQNIIELMCVCECVFVCAHGCAGTCRGLKRVSDLLELELLAVKGHLMLVLGSDSLDCP